MTKLKIILSLCLLLSSKIARCDDDINLDKLSDCQGQAAVQKMLEGPISENCRSARSRLEASVMSGLSTPNTHACLLFSPPTPRLSGFSCVEVYTKIGREITCFHRIEKSLIDSYYARFDSEYSQKAARYLNAAADCGNGDATNAPETVFPIFLNSVAQVRFGFALQIGSERKSQAYHGYADLNPDIDTNEGAIEVYELIRNFNPTAVPPRACKSKDGMVLEIQNAQDERRQRESMLKQAGFPAVVKIRFINFTYCGADDIPIDTKKGDLNDWQDQIKYLLDIEGYREPEPEDFTYTKFKDEDSMRDEMIRNIPYGIRENRTFGPNLVARIDDRYRYLTPAGWNPQCVVVADVVVMEPLENVKTDYGGIGMMFTGIGDCRTPLRPNGTLSEQLLDKVTENIRDLSVK